MQLKYKPDLDKVLTYWRTYWEREIIDRPVVCVLKVSFSIFQWDRKMKPKCCLNG